MMNEPAMTLEEVLVTKAAIQLTIVEDFEQWQNDGEGFLPKEDVESIMGAWHALEKMHAFHEGRDAIEYTKVDGEWEKHTVPLPFPTSYVEALSE
jgi:hypothetical protein